ncbi:hypothetical protein, partial [Vibrio cincinnatiensis]
QSKNTLKNKYTLNFNILRSFSLRLHNARLSGEQHYHDIQFLHRKHKSQSKPKLPSVANPS